MVVCPPFLKAQITLDYTFDTYVEFSKSSEISSNGDLDYYIYNALKNNYLYLYNKDFSIYKVIEIVPPAGYHYNQSTYEWDFPNFFYTSRKLFNTDEKIEVLISFRSNSNYYSDDFSKMVLYNEDGTVIYDFGSANSIRAHAYTISENHDCLFLTKRFVSNIIKTEVYSLRGASTGIENIIDNSKNKSPYPNPAYSIVNLPYNLLSGRETTMKIYDIHGRQIEQKQIDSQTDNLILDVANYKDGIYIYNLNGVCNKFVVKR